MSDDDRNPDLGDVIDLYIEHALSGFFTAQFGYVTRYDEVKQVVDVQPYNKRTIIKGDGSEEIERLPQAVNAPVIFPGNRAGRLTSPVANGDTVLLVSLSSSISRWLVSGVEAAPENFRQNTLSDCVAFIGGQSWAGRAKAPTTAPLDATVLHVGSYKGTELPLKLVSPLAASRVAVNSESAAIAAKLNALIAVVNTLVTQYNSHSHGVSGVTASPVVPGMQADSPPSGIAAPYGSARVLVPDPAPDAT